MAFTDQNTLKNNSVYYGSYLKVDDPEGVYYSEAISPKADSARNSRILRDLPWYLDSQYILWGKRKDGTVYARNSKQRDRARRRQADAIKRHALRESAKKVARKRKFDRVNNCSHFMLKLANRLYESTSGSQIPNGRDWGPVNQRYTHFAMYDLARLTANVRDHYRVHCFQGGLPPPNIQALIQKNLPKPEEFFPPVNVITILLELQESLLYLHQLKDVLNAFLKVARSKGNMLDAAANAYLFEVFGTLPLFSDIIRIISMLSHLNDFLDNFGRTRMRRYVHRRFSVSDPEPFGYSSSNPQHINYVNGSFTSRRYVSTKTTSHSLMPKGIFTLVYDELPVTNPLDYWKRLLGLDHIWQGIWDGLPFSWLVDYFTNIGKVLESVVRPMYLPHKLVNVCCSVKYEGSIVYDEQLDFWFEGSANKTVEHCQVLYDFKAYRRIDITNLADTLKELAMPKEFKFKLLPKYASQYANMAAVYRMVSRKK